MLNLRLLGKFEVISKIKKEYFYSIYIHTWIKTGETYIV